MSTNHADLTHRHRVVVIGGGFGGVRAVQALENEPVDVLLGGGLLRRPAPGLLASIERGLAEVGPRITVQATSAPPILGAALLALDALDAEPSAYERVRSQLAAGEPVGVGGEDG